MSVKWVLLRNALRFLPREVYPDKAWAHKQNYAQAIRLLLPENKKRMGRTSEEKSINGRDICKKRVSTNPLWRNYTFKKPSR